VVCWAGAPVWARDVLAAVGWAELRTALSRIASARIDAVNRGRDDSVNGNMMLLL
jgi:hypothetical protein